MGHSHTWTLNKTIDSAAWSQLERDAEILAQALSATVEARIKERMGKGPLAAFAGFCRLRFHRAHPPIHPGRPDGSYSGADLIDRQTRSILFSHSPSDSAEFSHTLVSLSNTKGEGWARTNALPHERVFMGLLCRLEQLAPGSIRVDDTDGEEDIWAFCADWASAALQTELPLPIGAPGFWERNAPLAARKEAQGLDADIPAARAQQRRPRPGI